MPAQIFITKGQVGELARMCDEGETEVGFVLTEGPGAAAAQAIDVWVMDEESLGSTTHRSVVLDPEGNVLGDQRLGDDE